jgi:hypothetical protein
MEILRNKIENAEKKFKCRENELKLRIEKLLHRKRVKSISRFIFFYDLKEKLS